MSESQVIPFPGIRKRRYLTAQQVARILQVSMDTVYRLSPRELPYLRVGRLRRYREADVLAYENRNREEG